MEVLLIHVCLVIIATAIAALVYGNVPYFPIEISRLAASGWLASHIFKWGLSILPIAYFLFSTTRVQPVFWAIFIGLQFVTFWDDVNHWFVHMFGVVIIGISAIVHVVSTWSNKQAIILSIAACIWVIRLILKFTMVVLFERPTTYAPYSIAITAMSIMYDGKCNNPFTLHVFRLCGVLQWIVFVLIGMIVI